MKATLLLLGIICLVGSQSGCGRDPGLLYSDQPDQHTWVPAPPQNVTVQSGPTPVSSIYGLVTDALDGSPLQDVEVTFVAVAPVSPISIPSLSTDGYGNFQTGSIPAGVYKVSYTLAGFVPLLNVLVSAPDGIATQANATLTPILPAGEYRMVLTWCGPRQNAQGQDVAVRDVDSYLIVPSDGPTNPIDYSNRGGTGANLDHDDTQWYGPETVTITNLQTTGTYIYYVNNYNDRSCVTCLGNSSAHITVYFGSGILKQYDVPQGSGLNWEAFRIVNGVFDDSQSQIYNDSLYMHPN